MMHKGKPMDSTLVTDHADNVSTRIVKTVRNYISNIFSKLQVADHAQAIVRAREAGMG